MWKLWVRRTGEDTWMVWVKGTLEECLEDLLDMKSDSDKWSGLRLERKVIQ